MSLGLRSIHGDIQLRRARQRVRANPEQRRTLRGRRQQRALRLAKLVARLSGPRLQIHVDAAELAETANGRQIHREDLRIGNAMQYAVDLRNQLHRRARSFIPVRKFDKRHAHVFASADKAETFRLEDAYDVLADCAV